MSAIGRFLRRAGYLLRRDQLDRDMDEEIRFHIEKETERYRAEGMTHAEARRKAMVAFGGVERHRAATREARGAALLDAWVWDVRTAARSARRSPRFTLAVALTLALGIGANTAIFSVVEAVLLRPLAVPAPERLVTVLRHGEDESPGTWYPLWNLAGFEFGELHARQESFEALAAVGSGSATLTGDVEPQDVLGVRVSEDYFRVIGVEPFLGRSFTAEEYRGIGANVVVISHDLWTARMGGDPDVLGREVGLEGSEYRVVGVMPDGFDWYRDASSTMPVAIWRADPWATFGSFEVVGRLREGVSVPQANAELQTFGRGLWSDVSGLRGRVDLEVHSLQEHLRLEGRTQLLMLLGAVALVLLIACLNVGNLLLARGEARLGAITLRRALGASRWRIARELVAESLVTSLLGAALGIAAARAVLPALAGSMPASLVRSTEVEINGVVLVFAVCVAVITAVLTGLAPALRLARPPLSEGLRARAFGMSVVPGVFRGRSAIVVLEVAAATVLVTGGALLFRSYTHVSGVGLGFATDSIAVVEIQLDVRDERYYRAEISEDDQPVYRVLPAALDLLYGVRDRMSGVRGATSVAAANHHPFPGWPGWFSVKPADAPEGWSDQGSDVPYQTGALYRPVTAEWFETLRIPLVEGRSFQAEEAARSEDVAVIDEKLARRLWPDRSAIGRSVMISEAMPTEVSLVPRSFRVVGVAADVRQELLLGGQFREASPAVLYFPPSSWSSTYHENFVLWRRSMTFVVRTETAVADIVPELKEAVWAYDPNLPVSVEQLSESVREPTGRLRANMGLMMAFAALALLLAASGVFAVMAYAVTRKAREFGIRKALGAKAGQLEIRELLRGLRTAAIGVGIGLALAIVLTRFIESFIYGIEALDPHVYAGTAALLTSVAAAAAYLPARWAAAVDPTQSLRSE